MLNKWCGIGRLVRDVEMKTTTNGTEVANFTLAINRTILRKDRNNRLTLYR